MIGICKECGAVVAGVNGELPTAHRRFIVETGEVISCGPVVLYEEPKKHGL